MSIITEIFWGIDFSVMFFFINIFTLVCFCVSARTFESRSRREFLSTHKAEVLTNSIKNIVEFLPDGVLVQQAGWAFEDLFPKYKNKSLVVKFSKPYEHFRTKKFLDTEVGARPFQCIISKNTVN